MEQTTLYRPVGLTEFKLIVGFENKAFPPRLDWQPIFYPVLNREYAAQIAERWNTQDAFSSYCGIVTRFELDTEYLQKYAVQNVGAEMHNELWIPAAELTNFNNHLLNGIEVIDIFFGEAFKMPEEQMISKVLEKFR